MKHHQHLGIMALNIAVEDQTFVNFVVIDYQVSEKRPSPLLFEYFIPMLIPN